MKKIFEVIVLQNVDSTEYVTIKDITDNLKVRRNFVYERILPCVEHRKEGAITRVNKLALCQWLEDSADFSRQTIMLSKKAVQFYAEEFKKKYPSEVFVSNLERYLNNRSKLPFRTVKSFDLWEKAVSDKLVHSKLFQEYGYKDEEELYRDMFKKGAIKIALGKKKTFFFVPEVSEDESTLCTAMDEEVLKKPTAEQKTPKQFGATIKAEGDPVFLSNLVNILRHHYRIEHSVINPKNFEIDATKFFY